jgi:hypothetical protein
MFTTLGMLIGGGGFPAIADSLYNEDGASPFSAVMPSTVNADDLLVLLSWRSSGTGTPSGTPSGWTLLDSAGTGFLYYKWAAGTEGGTLVPVTVSGSATMSFLVLRITGADPLTNPSAGASGLTSGSGSSVADPPANDPAWADANNLFVAGVGVANTFTVTYPTGYSLYQKNTVGSAGAMAVAAKELASSASENPGTMTLSGTDLWYAFTLAVKGT